jgi:hypothetical protein
MTAFFCFSYVPGVFKATLSIKTVHPMLRAFRDIRIGIPLTSFFRPSIQVVAFLAD